MTTKNNNNTITLDDITIICIADKQLKILQSFYYNIKKYYKNMKLLFLLVNRDDNIYVESLNWLNDIILFDSKINVLTHNDNTKNINIAKLFNYAILKTTTNYSTFLHVDTYLSPIYFFNILKDLSSNANIGVLGSKLLNIINKKTLLNTIEQSEVLNFITHTNEYELMENDLQIHNFVNEDNNLEYNFLKHIENNYIGKNSAYSNNKNIVLNGLTVNKDLFLMLNGFDSTYTNKYYVILDFVQRIILYNKNIFNQKPKIEFLSNLNNPVLHIKNILNTKINANKILIEYHNFIRKWHIYTNDNIAYDRYRYAIYLSDTTVYDLFITLEYCYDLIFIESKNTLNKIKRFIDTLGKEAGNPELLKNKFKLISDGIKQYIDNYIIIMLDKNIIDNQNQYKLVYDNDSLINIQKHIIDNYTAQNTEQIIKYNDYIGYNNINNINNIQVNNKELIFSGTVYDDYKYIDNIYKELNHD